MKHIFYLLDGYSPLAFKKCKSFQYQKKKLNFLDKLSVNSVFFENAFGYGETYPTIFSMFTGKNIYKNYCDAPNILFSYGKETNLGKIYKNKDFVNIYYCNKVPHYPTEEGFYKRYNNNLTDEFDYKCLKKKYDDYNLKLFLKEINLENLINQKKKLFFTIHDMSLHDNPEIYNGNINSHYKAFKKASIEVKKNLSLIKYNEKQDTLFFLSDHGLSPRPFNLLHTRKKIDNKMYLKYYTSMFVDEKIKFTFFIKFPNTKFGLNITKKIIPSDVFKIINLIGFDDNMKTVKILKKLKRILKDKIIISLKNAKSSPYGKMLTDLIFQFHFVLIDDYKKIIYSHNHPNQYLIYKKNLFKKISYNEVDLELVKVIKEYYSLKNYLKKLFFLFISYLIIIPSKIINKFIK